MPAVTERPTMVQNRVVVSLKPEVRCAIGSEFDCDVIGSEHIRALVMEALAARGWDEDTIRREYISYVADCSKRGLDNMFPGGRV